MTDADLDDCPLCCRKPCICDAYADPVALLRQYREAAATIRTLRADRDQLSAAIRELQADAARWSMLRHLWVNGETLLIPAEDVVPGTDGRGFLIKCNFGPPDAKDRREYEGHTATAAIDAAKGEIDAYRRG